MRSAPTVAKIQEALSYRLGGDRQFVRLYRLGVRALKAGRLDEAERQIRAAVMGTPNEAAWWHKLGFVQERAKRFDDALVSYQEAISRNRTIGEWYYRAGVCSRELRQQDQAADYFETALRIDPKHERAAEALVNSLGKGLPSWRRIELLELSAATAPTPKILQELTEALFAFGAYGKTAAALEQLGRVSSLNARRRALLAISHARSGEQDRANEIFDQLAREDASHPANREGDGYFFKERGDWPEAYELYARDWEAGNQRAEVAFGAAYCLDRQYRWTESFRWYRRALVVATEPNAYWNYKYAHALERCELYTEACGFYASALTIGGMKQRDWFYRLGTCLYRIDRIDEAYEALARWAGKPGHTFEAAEDFPEEAPAGLTFMIRGMADHAFTQLLTSAPVMRSSARVHLDLARRCRAAGDPERALVHYKKYFATESTVEAATAAEYAQLLHQLGATAEACRLLLNAREFDRPDGLDLKKLTRSDYDRRRMLYASYCERFEVDPKIVLFEGYWGTRISCNPLAIYLSMREDPRFSEHTFYWTVSKGTRVPAILEDSQRTILLEYGSPLYEKVLATAGTLVNNTSFTEYFTRRDGQMYLNTWHGTPMKTLGKRIGTGMFEHANVAHNFLNSTHLVLPNQHTADALLRDYDISALYRGQALVGGSPRLDRLATIEESERREVLTRMGIDPSDSRRVIFFAPTWRGGADSRSMDVTGARDVLHALSEIPDALVLFRAHHLVEADLEHSSLPALIVPEDIDTYEILACADVFITDYSSLVFDFLVTGRQAICYAPDVAVYGAERGLYMTPDEVVDDVATSVDELVEMAQRASFTPGSIYLASRERFCAAEDGHATARVLDYIAEHSETVPTSDSRTTLVFFTSLIPNGIFTSLLGLLRLIDRQRFRLVVVCDAGDVKGDPRRQESLKLLPDDVEVVGRFGAALSTPEERWLLSQFVKFKGVVSDDAKGYVRRAYQREFRRVLGPCDHAVVIDFEGYAAFWASLFAFGRPEGSRGLIYLHNQMADERDRRFPYLSTTMRLYREFDGVAAVSNATTRLNQEQLLLEFGTVGPEVSCVHNVLDAEWVVDLADREDESLWVSTEHGYPRLIMMGRLSSEKNHKLMVQALPEVLKSYPKAVLMVLGSGPLKAQLEAEAARLGGAEHVLFAGQISNPMPTLKAADLMVMSSKHEGLPMVLLEAMTLGVPVVTTPVPGCVEAAQLGGGVVVEDEVASLAAGVVAALDSGIKTTFDVDLFNSEAMREFESFVI